MLSGQEIGNRIKALRKEKQITQSELARKLNVSRQIISYYETGARMPKIETINLLAKSLDVPSDYFLKQNNIEFENGKEWPILTIDEEAIMFQANCPMCCASCVSKDFTVNWLNGKSIVEADFVCKTCNTKFTVKTSSLHRGTNNGKA